MPTAQKKRTYPFTKHFKEWLAVRSQGKTLAAREKFLKEGDDGEGGMKAAIIDLGDEDDKGNFFYDLPRAVEFQDEKGNVIIYTGLKAQRSLTPAQPVPDPELTEALLRKKGMWLNQGQEEQIRQLQMVSPYLRIEVVVDTSAVATAYLDKVISEKEYDSILVEQVERFSFVPLTDK